ncbi:MAG: hypothetical protein ACREJ5_01345 [Geminicoccaceae bacterium]
MRPALRSVLTACILVVIVDGCDAGHRAETPVFTTPEQALDYYIEGVRAGDLSRIIQVTHPPATGFYLPGPARIVDYEIVDKRILVAEDSAKDTGTPPSREGDVVLDVREVMNDNIENMFTYWFRKIGESWKLYAWSGWGTDDFCYEC